MLRALRLRLVFSAVVLLRSVAESKDSERLRPAAVFGPPSVADVGRLIVKWPAVDAGGVVLACDAAAAAAAAAWSSASEPEDGGGGERPLCAVAADGVEIDVPDETAVGLWMMII